MSLGGGGGQQELQELAQKLEAIEEQQAAVEAEIEELQTRKREAAPTSRRRSRISTR